MELLVVIGIIAILASLTLAAANTVWNKAARSRASAEIQAMSTGLENYKTDNGIYPPSTNLLGPPAASGYPVSPTGNGNGTYSESSQFLYQALSGQTNFLDDPVAGTKVYMPFKANQLGNTKATKAAPYASGSSTYIKDPWSYSYGYSTGDGKSPMVKYPYNGSGFFDLWSTGGVLADKGTVYATNTWVGSWNGN